MEPSRTVGVVGAGWAGLAAALELQAAGYRITVWDMAPNPGGRGRSGIRQSVPPQHHHTVELDCGQHILIGAYTESLRLMRSLGVDVHDAVCRGPLQLVDSQGQGLRLPSGHPVLAFLRGLVAHRAWPVGARWNLLMRLSGWHRAGFQCAPGTTVASLCSGLPAVVMDELIEPLCVAALNTPATVADGGVFLRVLGDGLFAGPGGSDLLIPRVPLHALLPGPAMQRLQEEGHTVHLGQRVTGLRPLGQGRWRVNAKDATDVDRLIVATSAPEAVRLLQPWDCAWAAGASQLAFDPIVTTWIHVPGVQLPGPMVRLSGGPAQFAFDMAAIGIPWSGGVSLVSSDAGRWLDRGLPALEDAALKQALSLPGASAATAQVVRSIAEKRATFRSTAGLQRPSGAAAPTHGGLWIAGDYVQGPYPSTLEGAVRAGVAAAHHVKNS